jgi:gas vesicle protein
MQTTAAIIIALFAGALFIVIIGGMAALIVLHIRGQKSAAELQKSMADFIAESKAGQESFQKELVGIVDGARSSFSGVRTEVAKALETQLKAVSKALKDQEQVFADKVGNINGEVLQASSLRALQACRDLSILTNTLRNMLVDHEVQPGADLAPEEYAPSDTIYAMQGAVDRADAASIRDEAEEMQPQFSQGMTE